MGQSNNRHRILKITKAVRAFVKNPYYLLISTMIPILIVVYKCGGSNMETKKDREMTEKILEYESKISEIEYQHRQELKDEENKMDEWREKYFQLLIERTETKGRSP